MNNKLQGPILVVTVHYICFGLMIHLKTATSLITINSCKYLKKSENPIDSFSEQKTA